MPAGRGRASRLRKRPRISARLRLTLLYAGMFLLLGTAMIAAIVALTSTRTAVVAHAVPARIRVSPGGQFQVQAAGPIRSAISQQHSSDVNGLLFVSWLVLAITAIASALLGWFASGRMLSPLAQMTSAARRISAGNLGERLALAGPEDEFKRLGDTFDDLLARLEQSFESQRRFAANASHELRTPLTLQRTLLQVALADPEASAEKLRATCRELLDSGRDQERLLDALLTLASSERGLIHEQTLDLAELARATLRAVEEKATGAGLRVREDLAPAPLRGDAALLTRLCSNLVNNAIDHNVPGGEIAVSTVARGGVARLTVANTGPQIPGDELPRLFEPFQRLGGDRPAADDGHHGLGLSIVRAIATAHGAEIEARPRDGGGLVVVVSFPPGGLRRG